MYKRCICGKFFSALTEKQKYCSEKCRPNLNYYIAKSIIVKECNQCKQYFPTRKNKQKFCSKKCRLLYHNLNKKWIIRVCECGNSFNTSKSYQIYCTHTCYLIAKNKRNKKEYQERKIILRRVL